MVKNILFSWNLYIHHYEKKPAHGPYPELDESKPCFPNIYFNIFPFMFESSKLYFPLKCSDYSFAHVLHVPQLHKFKMKPINNILSSGLPTFSPEH
jgi:hypothetical protein